MIDAFGKIFLTSGTQKSEKTPNMKRILLERFRASSLVDAKIDEKIIESDDAIHRLRNSESLVLEKRDRDEDIFPEQISSVVLRYFRSVIDIEKWKCENSFFTYLLDQWDEIIRRVDIGFVCEVECGREVFCILDRDISYRDPSE